MKKLAAKSPIIFEIVLIIAAFVLALGFGAIYIRTGNLFSVMIAHAAIDITNHVFGAASTTPTTLIIAFLALLAVEAVYAFVLVLRGKAAGEVTSSQLQQ